MYSISFILAYGTLSKGRKNRAGDEHRRDENKDGLTLVKMFPSMQIIMVEYYRRNEYRSALLDQMSLVERDDKRMLRIRITEDDPAALTAEVGPDGLPAFLAHCGVPHEVIHEALTRLPQLKTLLLCKPSEEEAWEIRVDC